MKKILFTLFLLVYAASVLSASGKIVEIDGNVTVQRAKTSNWQKAEMNMELSNADKIRTLFSSSAIIKLPDGSSITVGENTVLDMSSVTDKKSVNVKLVFGGLKADVMKRSLKDRTEFKVSTPTAVAGVRGTEFEASENAGGGTQFLVNDGEIEIETSKGKISLEKGQKLSVSKEGELGKKEETKEGESLVTLTDTVKEKLKEIQNEIREESQKYIEATKETEKSEKSDTDTADESAKIIETEDDKKDTAPAVQEEKKDTTPAQPRADLPSAADTAVTATQKTDTKPAVVGTPAPAAPKTEATPPNAPIIIEPADRSVISNNKINVSVNAEPNATVILKINNSEVSRQNSRAGDVTFSNIQLRDGQNKISTVAVSPKGLTSSEASVNINVITSLPAPQIISPAAGQNFDRGPAPVINIASADFLEWTKKNPLSIIGNISYKRQISIPEIKGKWVTAQNQGIEGDIVATVSIAGEEMDYTGRSDANGNFSISGINVNLSDDKFLTKINNEEVNAVAGNFQYIWIMEQGKNKLTIEAAEKNISITVKLRGRNAGGMESPIANFSYTSNGKNNMFVREQNLDSIQPIIQVDPIVTDNIVRITVRDPEPTSGVYKMTIDGFNCKRVEGSEKDSEQVWEANLQLAKPNLPPPPPTPPTPTPEIPRFRRIVNLKIKATDKAENTAEKNEVINVFYD